MKIHKSIVLTALLPEAVSDEKAFREGVRHFKSLGADTAEFFCEFSLAEKYGEILREEGMRGIFLAAAHQKKNKFWLSDLDEEKRFTAVKETLNCVKAASASGCFGVLITSGIMPDGEDKVPAACTALEKSIWQITLEMPAGMQLLLEPGDRTVDGRQLVGPTDMAVMFARRVQESCKSFSLTMDTSHIAQLFENAEKSLEQARWVSRHIHLASCILKEGHPLYGDKHPFFSDEDGIYTAERLQSIYRFIEKLYDTDEITVAVEIIGREPAGEVLQKITDEEKWFYTK